MVISTLVDGVEILVADGRQAAELALPTIRALLRGWAPRWAAA